jgi:hypothetical protein
MGFEAGFVEIGYVRKSGEMRAPGPAAEVGESVAEEIRAIG